MSRVIKVNVLSVSSPNKPEYLLQVDLLTNISVQHKARKQAILLGTNICPTIKIPAYFLTCDCFESQLLQLYASNDVSRVTTNSRWQQTPGEVRSWLVRRFFPLVTTIVRPIRRPRRLFDTSEKSVSTFLARQLVQTFTVWTFCLLSNIIFITLCSY